MTKRNGNATNGGCIGTARGLLVGALAFASCVIPTAHADDRHTIVVTFVRHGESTANAAGIIDTTVPGPDLTQTGEQQAQHAAEVLSVNNYDGIYASTMVRTQETAAPMSQALSGENITILPGLREIQAGSNEGLPVAGAQKNRAPLVWLDGNWDERIPGAITGNDFEARFNDAMATIYRSGETNPVVFSHGYAIQYWVLKNVKDKDKNRNLAPPAISLANTGHVVVTGSPADGWTLADWDGWPTPA